MVQNRVNIVDRFIPYSLGSVYGIYGNIYHQYTPVMLPYIPYIHGSVMGYKPWFKINYSMDIPGLCSYIINIVDRFILCYLNILSWNKRECSGEIPWPIDNDFHPNLRARLSFRFLGRNRSFFFGESTMEKGGPSGKHRKGY